MWNKWWRRLGRPKSGSSLISQDLHKRCCLKTNLLSNSLGKSSNTVEFSMMDSNDQNLTAPAGHLTKYSSNPNPSLKEFSTKDIFVEIFTRTQSNLKAPTEELAYIGHEISQSLSAFADVHLNRRSLTNLRNVYSALACPNAVSLPIHNATWVELGCGSINPWAFSFLLLAMGAERAIPIDLDPIADQSAACRTLAEMAKHLFIDPSLIIGPNDLKLTPTEIQHNLRDFNLAELNKGSVTGIPPSRLSYRTESVYNMSIPPGSADVVVSNAFLEHVPDVNKAIEAIARITKPGRYGVHVIDTVDHRIYGIPDTNPLDFLRINSTDQLIYGCNRLRPKEYVSIFEKNGFDVLDASYNNIVSLTEAEKSSFAPPWSSMSLDDLKSTVLNIVVQRRP